jgi:RNA polymerase sigma factor (TIGR02999 family)
MGSETDVTQLLLDWEQGDKAALERLVPLVSSELRRRAQRYLRRERADHSWQATDLVDEVYLRLIDRDRIGWRSRAHFFGIAARIMRRVLVDHARRRHAAKRGPTAVTLRTEDGAAAAGGHEVDLMALHEALQKLAEAAPRQARLVELRYFGGLTIPETAEALGVSEATVKLDWSMARAWLFKELRDR